MCPRRSRVLGSMWCAQRLREETAETSSASRGQPYSTFTCCKDPSPRCTQAIRKLSEKRRVNFMGSLNLCWRGRLQVCKLVSHPECQRHSYLPQRKGISRATVLLSAQDEAGGSSPGQSVKSYSGRKQKRVDLRSQNSLRITNGPTTFTTVQ